MKVSSQKRFRKTLNTIMLIVVLGTIPYIFKGDSLYRHELFGVGALVLMLYHCILNQWWYKRLLKTRKLGSTHPVLYRKNIINFILTISTIILLISSIMISGIVFEFLGIPYHIFWHYVHLGSGIVFLCVFSMHVINH